MDNILIVCSLDKAVENLTQLLNSYGNYSISSISNSSEARRLISNTDYELIIIKTPLQSEFGDSLAINIAQIYTSGVILIVKNEIVDEITAKVEDFGVLVVPNPIIRQVFFQSVKFAIASKKRLSGLKNENNKLQNKIEEIKIISRAKYVLIQHLNMTESQAHRYIEKHAMDLRSTRLEIAQNILKTYDS